MMYKYLQPKQNPGSKTGLKATTIFMLAIVGLFSAFLLSKIYFSVSFFADTPIQTKNYPLVTSSDFHKIQELALVDHRPILIFLRTEYCFPCDLMKERLFGDRLLREFIYKNFIFYEYDEFSLYQERQITANILLNNRLPNLLVSDAYGNIQGQISDIFDAQAIQVQLKNLLKYASSESLDRKSLVTSPPLDLDTAYEAFYGLEVDMTYDYYSARQLALEYKYIWNKDVWIQQKPSGHYRIILGTFDAGYRAQLTKSLIKFWKNVDGEVVKLRMDGEIY